MSDGTAVAGQDYESSPDSASGLIRFIPGVSPRTMVFHFVIRGNTVAQSNRFFFLNFGDAANGILERSSVKVTIVEDDLSTISIQGASVMEGNSGVTNALFKLSLWPPSPQPVSVDFQSADGSATAGADYSPRAGTLVFQPGITNQTLAIPVHGDTHIELDETFWVVLSGTAGAAIGINEASGQILNDDAVPPLAIVAFDPSGDAWRIRFNTASGQSYRLQRSSSLAPGSWLDVSGLIPGTGEPLDVWDAVSSTNTSAFYRIQRVP
jgi:hypothetical protein